MKAKDTPTLRAALKALNALECERKTAVSDYRDGPEWSTAFGLWADTRRAIALIQGIAKAEGGQL